MQLYFNGDSFVAGVELGDDLIEGYPGLLPWPMTTKQHDINREWLRKSQIPLLIWQTHPRKTKFDEIIKLEFERAFPNKVSTLTNLPVVNRALAGASMDHIVRTSMTDLYNMKKENPTEKLVAYIGTTYPHRWEVAHDITGQHDIYGLHQDWICISSSYTVDTESDYLKSIRKYKTMHYTPYHATVNFYKNVVLLQDFCKLNDIELHWISTFDNIIKYPLDIDEFADRKDINMLIEYANFKYTIDMREIIETEFDGQNVICPGGHFGEPVHDRVAKKIVEMLHG